MTLETAVALALGHLVADFLLQSNAMVRHKQRPLVLLGHVGIVVAASWAALGFAPLPLLFVVIGATHLLFDSLKLRWSARRRASNLEAGFAAFAVDQAGHLAVIALAAALWPGAWTAGIWGDPDAVARLPALARLPEAMALAAGVIATVWAGGYAVRELMSGLKLPADPAEDASLPQGGQLIGRLERLMILMLVLAEPAGRHRPPDRREVDPALQRARPRRRRPPRQRVCHHRHAGELRLGDRHRLGDDGGAPRARPLRRIRIRTT